MEEEEKRHVLSRQWLCIGWCAVEVLAMRRVFFSYGQTTRLLVMGEVHIPAHCRLVHAIRFILLWRNGIPWAEKCYGWIRT